MKSSWKLQDGSQPPKLLNLTRKEDQFSVDLVPLVPLLTQSADALLGQLCKIDGHVRLSDFGKEGSCFGLRYGLKLGASGKRFHALFKALADAGFHGWRGSDQQGREEYVIFDVLDASGLPMPMLYTLDREEENTGN